MKNGKSSKTAVNAFKKFVCSMTEYFVFCPWFGLCVVMQHATLQSHIDQLMWPDIITFCCSCFKNESLLAFVEYCVRVRLHWPNWPSDRSTNFLMSIISLKIQVTILVFPVRVPGILLSESWLHPVLWVQKKIVKFRQRVRLAALLNFWDSSLIIFPHFSVRPIWYFLHWLQEQSILSGNCS